MIRLQLQKKLEGPQGPMRLELDLEIHQGEFVSLYGPSGAGKTSTLRMLSGLMKPDSGTLVVDGTTWFDNKAGLNLKPQDRNVGLLFQDYALFPHLTVRKNLEYALNRGEDPSHLEELLKSMELVSLQDRKPQTLSGGQQQRVALARCLVRKPSVLLLDEPLSALDPGIRFRLQDYILKMHRRYGLTTLMVSHDLGEIHKLSDRVVELNEGKIRSDGSPSSLFAGKDLGDAFTMAGEILALKETGSRVEVLILVQNSQYKFQMRPEEVAGFAVGDRVILGSESFDPILHKAR